MEKRELTCIGCPLGCPITVTIEENEIREVTGNTCPRGDAYARKEVTHPTRIVTSTVRVTGGASALVSCKTKNDVPKEKIFAVMEALRGAAVAAPVRIGDVLVHDIAGTGADIVATRDVAALPQA